MLFLQINLCHNNSRSFSEQRQQPFLSPWDLPGRGIEPRSPALRADSLPSDPPGTPKRYSMSLLLIAFQNLG